MAVKANYETVMIISMKKGEEGIGAIVDKFKALIEKNATLKNVDEWGKRKLAYLINKESEGYYVLFDFESEAEFPAELDRVCNITDGVIRSMIIKKEDEKKQAAAEEAPAETPAEAAAEEETAE